MTPNPLDTRVVLDANVLVPASLRDTLLRGAEEGLYVPFWSREVLVELHRTLVENELASIDAVTRLIDAIQRSFPDSITLSGEPLIGQLTNDPKDRHVLAAAILTGSAQIVTFNTRHFSETALGPHGVTAVTPDMFLQRLLRSHPERIIALLKSQAAELRKRPMSLDDVLQRLERHTPMFVKAARTRLSITS